MESEHFAAEWGRLGEEALSGMSAWRKAHPRATLTEIEEETDRRLAALRARLVEEVAQNSAAAEGGRREEPLACPSCGGQTVRNGKRQRRLTTQHEQMLHLEREQMRCGRCGQTFFPPG